MDVLSRGPSISAGTVAIDVLPAAELKPSWIVTVNEAVTREPPAEVPVVGERSGESMAEMVVTPVRVVTEVTQEVSKVAANSC